MTRKKFTALCGLHGCPWRCEGHQTLTESTACIAEHRSLAHGWPR